MAQFMPDQTPKLLGIFECYLLDEGQSQWEGSGIDEKKQDEYELGAVGDFKSWRF